MEKKEENNKSKHEEKEVGMNLTENNEIVKSNKSSEREKDNNSNKGEIKSNEQNNLEKSLTEKNSQNKEIHEKDISDNNLVNKINNSNDENDDLTNIKYVTEKQLDQLNQEKNEKEKYLLHNKNTLITIKDLQQNPNKKMIINSPRSLKALYDSGYSLDQLYHKTLDEFVEEHKELLHIEEEAKISRYHFFEKLRMDKINTLVDYREKMILDELDYMNNYNKNNIQEDENKIKPMKSIILDNDKRIAQEEIDIMQKKHEKELANLIQIELDKDLFNLEMKKQQEDYEKRYQKLNFLNFRTATQNNDSKEEEPSEEQKSLSQIPLSEKGGMYFITKNVQKYYKSISLPKKPRILVDSNNNYLDNLYNLQQTLMNQKYEKKQKIVEQKLERLEKIRKITGEQRALKKRIGVERAAQNLQKNAIDFNKKHEDLIKEIQDKKIIIYQNKKKFENIIKNKNEWNNIKYLVKMDLIEDLKRKDENLRLLKFAELLEKQSKTDIIKNERNNVLENKLLKKEYLDNERKKNIIKINQILNSGINKENLDRLIKEFPQNQELLKIIRNYKKNKNTLLSKEHKNFNEKKVKTRRPKSQGKLFLNLINKNTTKNRDDINKKKELPSLTIPNIFNNDKNEKALTETNKISNESDIKEKIKLYKDLHYKKFYEKVQQERENEEMRLKELEKIEDKNKKYQLEKKFRKERALVYMRLERENQKMNEKINMYELKLKNMNEKI